MRKTQGSNNSGEVVKKFQEKLENNGRIMNYNKTPKNQIEILRNNELENLWKERLKNKKWNKRQTDRGKIEKGDRKIEE